MNLRTAIILYGAECAVGDREKQGRLFADIEAKIESLQRDALRYRWARAARKDKAANISSLIRLGIGAFSYELPAESDLDAAIDEAMK